MAAPVRGPPGETPGPADAEGMGAASLADSPVPDSWQMHERRAPAALRPYVSSYTGYRMEASPRSTHHGVASPHLTLLLCLDGKIEILANADRSKPPGAFVAMVGGLHDGPAELAEGEPTTGRHRR